MCKGLICEVLHPLTKTSINESFFFLFFFLKIEKIIAKKKQHTESANGSREDKPKSTRAQKFTKKFYYSNVVDNTI
jgi:hypothetical protein